MLDPIAQPQVDVTDPLVVVAAWLVTWLVGRLSTRLDMGWVRPLLPAVTLAVAMGCRVAYEAAMTGEALSFETVLRAFASGFAAVWAHSMVRGAQKVTQPAETVDAA